MLDALRRGATSWVLKPLLLLLVLSFIVWGVADVFTGTRTGSLANVGSAQISTEEFQATYGAVMNNFARRFGKRPTAEEARARGLDRAVLEDLINSATLDQHASELRLDLPQQAVVANIEKDQTFAGPDGAFDRAAFNGFLREIGYSERGFLNLRRKEEIRQQLTQSVFQNLPVPGALANLVHSWREEARTLQHFTIDVAKLPPLAEPDEGRLKEVYGAQQRRFVTPEARHIGVLVLSAAEAKTRLDLKDEELRKIYEQDKTGQVVPEQRRIQQIPYKDAAAASAAAKAIAAGKTFLDAAKEAGATENDINLGLVTQTQMIDPTIAAAAFALAKDRVSTPVAGRFSTVLLRATEIIPGKTRSFDEMKEEIRGKLADARVNETLRKLYDAVDDGRGAGKPLKEIAEGIKAKYYDIPATDRLGRKPDGTQAYDGPDAPPVLKVAFEAKTGAETDVIDLTDGGYAWVDLIGVTEEKPRAFEDIKDDVKALWRELEQSRLLGELAARLIERGGKGETMTALAAESGGKLVTTSPFKRFGSEVDLPQAAVQRAFALPLGGRAAVDAGEGKRRIVFRVVEITKPIPATKEQIGTISDQLRTEFQQDAAQSYVTTLRERYGVNVNETLFRRTTGESSDTR